MPNFSSLSNEVSLIGCVLGVPTLVATYYQAWKARKEAGLARQGLLYSENCVEFILDDGTVVNVVSLESLHSLPKPEDIILLPGAGFEVTSEVASAFRVERVEHIYTRLEVNALLPRQARLAKVVAHVEHLTPRSMRRTA